MRRFNLLLYYVIKALYLTKGIVCLLDGSCQRDVNSWLQTFDPIFNQSRSELTLDWKSLETILSSCSYSNYQAELWALQDSIKNENDFGSIEYWSQFERCTKLSPEILKFHSRIVRYVGRNHSSEDSIFRYIVEKKYIIRICHCPKENGNRAPCSRACFSLANSFCSRLIENPVQNSETVSPWCQSDSLSGGSILFNHVEEHNCTSLKISGEVQTCTPVQDYDLVEVTLHPVIKSQENCSQSIPTKANSPKATVSLIRSNQWDKNYSKYTGHFTHLFSNLSTDFRYCVQIEIKNNPYCRHEFVLNHFRGPPSVCNKYLDIPLELSEQECSPGIVWVKDEIFITLALVIFSSLLLIFMAVALTFLVRSKLFKHKLVCARRKKGWLFYDTASVPNVQISPIRSFQKKKFQNNPKADVLLIYFNSSVKDQERNALLKKWLQSFETNVVDLNNDEDFEEKGLYSECQIEALIDRRETKIVIVNSQIICRTHQQNPKDSLHSDEPSIFSLEKEQDESLLYEDTVLDLKLSTIHYIKTNYYANYEKVSVINYSTSVIAAPPYITPGRMMVLPDHFNVLRGWILYEDGALTRISPTTHSIEQELSSNLV